MSYIEGISTDPGVLRGKPVVKNTRISVALILRKLSQGASHEDLLRSYPRLGQEDILASFKYASVCQFGRGWRA